MKAIITKKVGMTSTIEKDGTVAAVTLLSTEPNVVSQIKTIDPDGYNAVQLGFEEIKADKLPKPQSGHLKAAGITTKIIKEIRLPEAAEDLKVGDKINLEVFSVGDKVDAIGVSKGKGWAGTIKRHNFHRGRKTQGGRSYRRVGSIGSMYPQKIFKGKKMAGHMGHERVTVKNLKVVLIDSAHNVIGISGAIPGPRRGIVLIKGVE